eukprot:snap_masked-scaffold_1-processed-gene-19.66-mRNA-1 protein AED:1.00 eAED:1.00 QI:0/0/0/0/1/1/2/0/347
MAEKEVEVLLKQESRTVQTLFKKLEISVSNFECKDHQQLKHDSFSNLQQDIKVLLQATEKVSKLANKKTQKYQKYSLISISQHIIFQKSIMYFISGIILPIILHELGSNMPLKKNDAALLQLINPPRSCKMEPEKLEFSFKTGVLDFIPSEVDSIEAFQLLLDLSKSSSFGSFLSEKALPFFILLFFLHDNYSLDDLITKIGLRSAIIIIFSVLGQLPLLQNMMTLRSTSKFQSLKKKLSTSLTKLLLCEKFSQGLGLWFLLGHVFSNPDVESKQIIFMGKMLLKLTNEDSRDSEEENKSNLYMLLHQTLFVANKLGSLFEPNNEEKEEVPDLFKNILLCCSYKFKF